MDIDELHRQLEQKKREIATWEFTLNRAKGEVERLNNDIQRLAHSLAREVVKREEIARPDL